MFTVYEPSDVLARLSGWAEQHDGVRAVLLTSTRAIPGAAVDVFSDYDVILVVTDIRPFWNERSWMAAFGEVLVAYWDPIGEETTGFERTGNVTYFNDGLHIDFSLWPAGLLEQIAAAPRLTPELEAGYRVVLDKDGLTTTLRAPSYRGYIPERPSALEYQTTVGDFLSSAPYVAKYLWRDELLPAKWALGCDMQQPFLRHMLEWYIQGEHGWSAPVGVLGRGLKRRLPPELWSELERTYAGADIAANWEALFGTLALFRRVALEVAAALGYSYPLQTHERVVELLRWIKDMPRTQS